MAVGDSARAPGCGRGSFQPESVAVLALPAARGL
jgi:hypothetical protein